MKKSPLCFLLLFLCHAFAFAQKNFKTAYIVTLDRDTVRGLIDYKRWYATPQEITFKKDENAPEAYYGPADISTFWVEKKLFHAKTLTVDVRSDILNRLDSDPKLKLIRDTVFVEALFEGPKSLYGYYDKSEVPHFFIKAGDTLQLLIYKTYFSDLDEKTVVANKTYQDQLRMYFGACRPAALAPSGNPAYSVNSMVSLFRRYYRCSDSTATLDVGKRKATLHFGAVAGLTNTTVAFRGEGPRNQILGAVDLGSSTDYTFGLFADLQARPKTSVYNELIFTQYSFKGSHRTTVSDLRYTNSDIAIAMSYIRLNTMLRLHAVKYDNGGIFASLGVSNGLGFVRNNETNTESYYYGVENTTKDETVTDPKKYEFGLLGGIGGSYKKFSLEGRYQRGNGMASAAALQANTNTFLLMVGYRFK